FTRLDCGTAHDLAVRARDAVGNASAWVTLRARTADCPDRTPPTLPGALAVADRKRAAITLSWTASTDASPPVVYELRLDGAAAGTATTASSTFPGLDCGTQHDLAVRARDAAGNATAWVTLKASTADCPDTTPPTLPGALAV